MLNILTIDVEDYFQVHAFSNVIRYENWDNYECRIERNVDRILEILDSACSPIVLKPQHRSTSAHEHFEHRSTAELSDLLTHDLNNSLTQKGNDSSSLSPCAMPYAPCVAPRATFFILGWIAERYPGLVRRIQKEGHEIACHGYAHKLIYNQSKEEFREDIRKAKTILEDIIGGEVIGYRSPSYSVTKKSRWALEILAEEGFRYDSSIFPIRHDFYGFPDAPRFPFLISLNGNSNVEFSVLNYELKTAALADDGTAAPNHSNNSLTYSLNNLLPHSLINSIAANSTLKTHNSKFIIDGNSKLLIEFPISTVKLFGQNVPISGGGYFRLFPYSLIKKGLRSINEKESKPFIFYVHPWEFDADQPKISGLSLRSKFRHYVNLRKTEERFRRLLEDFQFSTFREILIQNSKFITQNSKLKPQ